MRDRESELDHGDWTDPAGGRQLTSEWVRRHIEAKNASPAWHAALNSYQRRHVEPRWQMPLAAVTHTQVTGWVRDLSKTLAPDTVAGIFHLLSGAMDAAIADGLIRRNPCAGVRLPDKREHEATYLTRPQVHALADTIAPRYRALILTAAYTGMRWGELAGLTHDRLDLQAGRVTVAETLTEVAGHLGTGAAKTRTSHGRSIPLPDMLVAELEKHLVNYQLAAGSHQLVFTGERGAPLRRKFLERKYRPAAIAAGLPAGVVFHDLRHTFVALTHSLGVDIVVISKWLGHRDVRITTSRYARILRESEQRALDTINGALNLNV